MKAMEKNVMRLVAVQHLRTAYGIKTKNWNKHKATSSKTISTSVSKTPSTSHLLDHRICTEINTIVFAR